MKTLSLVFLIVCVSVAISFGQAKQINLYDTARVYYFKKDFEKAFINYDRHYSDSTHGKSNYDSYYAAVAACQTGRKAKAEYYLKYAFRAGFYPAQYEEIALDPLNTCLREFPIWKPYIEHLKFRKDSLDQVLRPIRTDLTDKSLQAPPSFTGQTVDWGKSADAAALKNKIQSFNSFQKPAKTGFWTLYYIQSDTINVPYLVYIPKTYDTTIKTPLYVFLHGGVSNRKVFVKDAANTVDDQRLFLKRAMDQNAFIIWPYARADFNWLQHQKAFETIMKEVAMVKSSYNIDDNKVYMGGYSDGGAGAFWFALNNPSSFAATFAMSYFPRLNTGNTQLRNLQNEKPFYGLSGNEDTGMPIDYVNIIYEYSKKNGGNWINRIFNGSHTFPYDNPDSVSFLYDQLASLERNPFPRTVNWETDNVKNGRNSWIAITELDTAAEAADWQRPLNPEIMQNGKLAHFPFNKNKSGAIKASANGNEINIQASRVKRIKLFLSAEMFDFNKQIRITVNGVNFINIKPEADKAAMLDEFLKTRDRTFIVSSILEFTVDDKKH